MCWKTFRDDVFVSWNQSWKSRISFLYFIHSIDTTGKIKFTVPVANEYILEFLYLSWNLNEQKTSVLLFMPSLRIALRMCFILHVILKRNMNNIPKGIALKLSRISISDEKLGMRSDDYQN